MCRAGPYFRGNDRAWLPTDSVILVGAAAHCRFDVRPLPIRGNAVGWLCCSPRFPDAVVGGSYGFDSRSFHCRGIARALIQTMDERRRPTNEGPFDSAGTYIPARCSPLPVRGQQRRQCLPLRHGVLARIRRWGATARVGPEGRGLLGSIPADMDLLPGVAIKGWGFLTARRSSRRRRSSSLSSRL